MKIDDSAVEIQQSKLFSDHPPLHPGLYRLKRWMAGLGLALIGVALLGGLLLMLGGYPAQLLPLIMAFTLLLSLPLWVGTALNPPVTATEDGLIVRPMFGRAQFVPWDTIRAIRPHPLLATDEGLERLLFGRRAVQGREGVLVVVKGALSPRFRLAAWIGGLGNVAVFGISRVTHRDYQRLLRIIRRRASLDE